MNIKDKFLLFVFYVLLVLLIIFVVFCAYHLSLFILESDLPDWLKFAITRRTRRW